MTKIKPLTDALFRDSSESKEVVVTKNGFKLNISVEDLIERERESLGKIMDNVVSTDKISGNDGEDQAAQGAET